MTKRHAHFGSYILALAALLLSSTAIQTNCDGEKKPPGPQGTLRTDQPRPRPDLVVSTIEVFPVQPHAGTPFALNVYVKNAGSAPSGAYDLKIFIKDVSRSLTYPVGTFRRQGLQPGENVVAYSSTDRLVNDPGAYQVHVEIEPFLFEDGNPQNNQAIWAFTVN